MNYLKKQQNNRKGKAGGGDRLTNNNLKEKEMNKQKDKMFIRSNHESKYSSIEFNNQDSVK